MGSTIAAYSGGALPAAIGIIRLSGDDAGRILDSIFNTAGLASHTKRINKQLYYGKLSDKDGFVIDLCMASFHRAPHTFSGEDMAEIYCHGSAAIVSSALEHIFALGAAPAEAGEFTKRAFLNGKLDLTEAEATADLIYALSPAAARAAAGQLMGNIGGAVKQLRRGLVGQLAHFYAVCDYTDEEIDPYEYDSAREVLEAARRELTSLFDGYSRGRYIREGVPVAIIGRPNAGKSTLFNALAGFERAIVTDEAGTTRDIIDHVITCGGAAVRLLDTAGLRAPRGKAEEIGIEKARGAANAALASLCVIDCAAPVAAEDEQAARLALGAPLSALVLSKGDIASSGDAQKRMDELRQRGVLTKDAAGFDAVFEISVHKNEGIDAIAAWLGAIAPQGGAEILVTSARQAALLQKAACDLASAIDGAAGGVTADAFLSDVERAIDTLGKITGETADDEIAHEIFSRFCVGK